MTSSKVGRYKITAQLTMGKAPKNGEPPHAELANMGDDVAAGWAFYDRWGALVSDNLTPPEQAERLRAHRIIPCPYTSLEQRNVLREAWRGDEHALEYIKRSAGQYMRFAWEFNGKEIALLPEDLWSTMALFFLRDRAANRLGICENPGCHSPYFVKRRSSQKLCEAGACTQWARRQYALRHWNLHGKQQRQEQREQAQKKSSRRGK